MPPRAKTKTPAPRGGAARGATPRAGAAARAAAARQRAPLTISRPELLVDGSDASFRRLVHNLFAFAARHDAVRNGHGGRIGLTGIEYTFLISIRHLEDDGDVSVRLLADHLHLSGPFATTMVGKLIARGLVVKDVDPADRRRVRLRVTPQGHALLAELAPTQRQVNDVQFGCLSRDDFETLLKLLERLIESADQAISLQGYLAMQTRPSAVS